MLPFAYFVFDLLQRIYCHYYRKKYHNIFYINTYIILLSKHIKRGYTRTSFNSFYVSKCNKMSLKKSVQVLFRCSLLSFVNGTTTFIYYLCVFFT